MLDVVINPQDLNEVSELLLGTSIVYRTRIASLIPVDEKSNVPKVFYKTVLIDPNALSLNITGNYASQDLKDIFLNNLSFVDGCLIYHFKISDFISPDQEISENEKMMTLMIPNLENSLYEDCYFRIDFFINGMPFNIEIEKNENDIRAELKLLENENKYEEGDFSQLQTEEFIPERLIFIDGIDVSAETNTEIKKNKALINEINEIGIRYGVNNIVMDKPYNMSYETYIKLISNYLPEKNKSINMNPIEEKAVERIEIRIQQAEKEKLKKQGILKRLEELFLKIDINTFQKSKNRSEIFVSVKNIYDYIERNKQHLSDQELALSISRLDGFSKIVLESLSGEFDTFNLNNYEQYISEDVNYTSVLISFFKFKKMVNDREKSASKNLKYSIQLEDDSSLQNTITEMHKHYIEHSKKINLDGSNKDERVTIINSYEFSFMIHNLPHPIFFLNENESIQNLVSALRMLSKKIQLDDLKSTINSMSRFNSKDNNIESLNILLRIREAKDKYSYSVQTLSMSSANLEKETGLTVDSISQYRNITEFDQTQGFIDEVLRRSLLLVHLKISPNEIYRRLESLMKYIETVSSAFGQVLDGPVNFQNVSENERLKNELAGILMDSYMHKNAFLLVLKLMFEEQS